MSPALVNRPEAGSVLNPWWALLAVAMGQLMVVVDITVLNIALPTISSDLEASVPELEWAVIAYTLTMIGLVPTLGRLSDVIGRKRLYAVGLLVFGGASALAGLSSSIGALVAARVVQALGGALITSNTLAILTDVFPPGRRGVAMGIQSILISGGAATGPPLGGFLVTNFGWEAVFWVNVPISLAAFLLASKVLKRHPKAAAREPIDWPGAALLLVGLVGVLTAVSRGPEWGWRSPAIAGSALAGVALLGLFVWRQHVAAAPIIKPALFRLRPFVAGQAAGLLGTMSLVQMVFTLPFYWQALRGETAQMAGLLMLPLPLGIMIVAPISGRLSDRYGARGLASGGLTLVALGAGLLSRVGADTPIADVLWRVAVLGIGLGAFLAPNNNAIMSSAPQADRGVASGLLALFRFLGQSLGIVTAGTVLSHFAGHGDLRALLDARHSLTPAMVSAAHEELLAGFHVVCLAVVPTALGATLASLSRGSQPKR